MEVISKDFQGWPVYKLTLRELLTQLGFEIIETEKGNFMAISSEDPKLDAYIRDLEDDGMGYGINQRWITEGSFVETKEGNFINVFREVEDPNLDKSEFER